MTKSSTENKSYTERMADAQNDDSLDKTATGGQSLVMSDGANESLKAYNPQPHDESHLGVLREDAVLPKGEASTGSLKEVVTEVVDADHAAPEKAETPPTKPAGVNTRPRATTARK